MLTGRVETSQTKCLCSQDKLHLAWIENFGCINLKKCKCRQRSYGCQNMAKLLLVWLQDLSLPAAGNNSKKLDLSLECMRLANLESACTDLILAHLVVQLGSHNFLHHPKSDVVGHRLVEVGTIVLHFPRKKVLEGRVETSQMKRACS